MVWLLLYKVMRSLFAGQSQQEGEKGKGKMWKAQFWAAHQRFYRSMLMAAKVESVAQLSKEALNDGMCVVIGLQSTGEASAERTRQEQETDEFEDLVGD